MHDDSDDDDDVFTLTSMVYAHVSQLLQLQKLHCGPALIFPFFPRQHGSIIYRV
jgi:hypothetical protein